MFGRKSEKKANAVEVKIKYYPANAEENYYHGQAQLASNLIKEEWYPKAAVTVKLVQPFGVEGDFQIVVNSTLVHAKGIPGHGFLAGANAEQKSAVKKAISDAMAGEQPASVAEELSEITEKKKKEEEDKKAKLAEQEAKANADAEAKRQAEEAAAQKKKDDEEKAKAKAKAKKEAEAKAKAQAKAKKEAEAKAKSKLEAEAKLKAEEEAAKAKADEDAAKAKADEDARRAQEEAEEAARLEVDPVSPSVWIKSAWDEESRRGSLTEEAEDPAASSPAEGADAKSGSPPGAASTEHEETQTLMAAPALDHPNVQLAVPLETAPVPDNKDTQAELSQPYQSGWLPCCTAPTTAGDSRGEDMPKPV